MPQRWKMLSQRPLHLHWSEQALERCHSDRAEPDQTNLRSPHWNRERETSRSSFAGPLPQAYFPLPQAQFRRAVARAPPNKARGSPLAHSALCPPAAHTPPTPTSPTILQAVLASPSLPLQFRRNAQAKRLCARSRGRPTPRTIQKQLRIDTDTRGLSTNFPYVEKTRAGSKTTAHAVVDVERVRFDLDSKVCKRKRRGPESPRRLREVETVDIRTRPVWRPDRYARRRNPIRWIW